MDRPDEKNQLLLSIVEEQRKSMTAEQLIEFIIHLYGDEFIKANDEIARLKTEIDADAKMLEELRRLLAEQKQANDELFRIKQRVVIANREIRQRSLEWIERWQGSDDGKAWFDVDDPSSFAHKRRIRIKA